jgi:hypothetical protein
MTEMYRSKLVAKILRKKTCFDFDILKATEEKRMIRNQDQDSTMPVKALKKNLNYSPFFANFCLSWIRTWIINLKGECHEMNSFFEGPKP